MFRLKHAVDVSVIKEMSQLVWARITLSRLTSIYFVFAIVHCIIQVLFQGQAFQTNASAATLIKTILQTANATSNGFALLDGDLIWCQYIPVNGKMNGEGCGVIWKGAGSSGSNSSLAASENYSTSTSVSVTSTNRQTSTTVPAATPTSVIATGALTNADEVAAPVQVTVTTFVLPTPTTLANSAHLNKRFSSPPADPFLTSDPLFPKTKSNKRFSSPPADPFLTSDPLFPKNKNVKRHVEILVTSTSTSTDPEGHTVTTIEGLPNAPEKLTLDQTCLVTLNWPLEMLEDTVREDITFIVFHLWVLGVSIVGLLNESIPHMLASFVTHIAVTAWSAFQLVQTRAFQRDFSHFITGGACAGQNLLPTYWRDRANAEIPSAAFNSASLLISAYLTYKLIKTYNWATFKRIGASRTISKIYKIVLSLSVVLQLSVFFIIVSIALWIDQLCNGVIGRLTDKMTVYRIVYIVGAVFLVPWMIIGWKASRMELRTMMHVFLLFNVVLIGGWGSMFACLTFRWTFTQWRFFSVISTAAVILTVMTLVLGILSRKNFGYDLPKYLNAQSKIEDDEEFVSASDDMSIKGGSDWDSEKISFPSNGPVPTFGSTFGSNPPSRNTSNQSSALHSNGSYSQYPRSIAPAHIPSPPYNASMGDWDYVGNINPNRISVSSAHSASSIDVPKGQNATKLSSAASSPTRTGRPSTGSGGKKLVKKWVIE